MGQLDEGSRVAVTVAGERRTGVVTDREYTAKYGQLLLAVSLDDPLPDGSETHLALAGEVEPAG